MLQKLRNSTIVCKLSMLVWSAQVMQKGWVVGDADDVLCHVFFSANLESFYVF